MTGIDIGKILDFGLAGFIFVTLLLAFREFKAVIKEIMDRNDEERKELLDRIDKLQIELVNLRRDFNRAVTLMEERTRGPKTRPRPPILGET